MRSHPEQLSARKTRICVAVNYWIEYCDCLFEMEGGVRFAVAAAYDARGDVYPALPQRLKSRVEAERDVVMTAWDEVAERPASSKGPSSRPAP